MGEVCKGTTGVVYTQVDSVDLPNVYKVIIHMYKHDMGKVKMF